MRRATGGGAHHRADHRHHTQQLRHVDAGVGRTPRQYAIAALGRGNTAAVTIDQADQWNAIVEREVITKPALPALAPPLTPTGAAAHGGIFAAHRHATAIDFSQPHDIGRGLYFDQLAVFIFALARELADFLKGSRVHQARDTFAHGERAALMHALNGLCTAQFIRPLAA